MAGRPRRAGAAAAAPAPPAAPPRRGGAGGAAAGRAVDSRLDGVAESSSTNRHIRARGPYHHLIKSPT
jgi:hypothetical protein